MLTAQIHIYVLRCSNTSYIKQPWVTFALHLTLKLDKIEQCFVFWLPSPDSNLVLDTPKKQNLISIGQFAASNDAPVRSHSDRVKGFKFKVKALSLKLKL